MNIQKYFVTSLAIAFIAPTAAFASFNTSLSYDESGPNVITLQAFLISQKCLHSAATGYFGTLTLAGVKCFQTKYGISDTGFFGVMSRTAANQILTFSANPAAELPAQTNYSTVNMSVGGNAVAPLSSLIGGGSSTVFFASPSSTIPLSPLAGSGSTTVLIPSPSSTVPLSPLIQ